MPGNPVRHTSHTTSFDGHRSSVVVDHISAPGVSRAQLFTRLPSAADVSRAEEIVQYLPKDEGLAYKTARQDSESVFAPAEVARVRLRDRSRTTGP